MAPPKTAGASRGTMHATGHQNLVSCTIRATPLPEPIVDFLRNNLAVLRRLQYERAAVEAHTTVGGGEERDAELDEAEQFASTGDIVRVPTVRSESFWDTLFEICKTCGGEWASVVDTIWAFGPHGAGECLLIDARKDGPPNSYVPVTDL
jgi:ribosome assembly protein 1